MTTPPDPSSIDWNAVSLWAAGIGTGIGSMIGAVLLGIRKAVRISKTASPTITTREETKIVTTDTVAMHELAGGIEALNVSIIENREVFKEILDVEMDIRDLLKAEFTVRAKERDERDREEEYARIARRAAEEVQRESEEENDRRRPARRTTGGGPRDPG